MGQRKLKRRHLIYYLRVYDTVTEGLIGHLVDITVDGMMIMSENPIKENIDFSLKMKLPDGFEATKEIRFKAVAIWTKKDINPDFYATGFKFTDIQKNDEEFIESLIDDFGFRD